MKRARRSDLKLGWSLHLNDSDTRVRSRCVRWSYIVVGLLTPMRGEGMRGMGTVGYMRRCDYRGSDTLWKSFLPILEGGRGLSFLG